MDMSASTIRKSKGYLLLFFGMLFFFWMTCRIPVRAENWTLLGDASGSDQEYLLTQYHTKSYGGVRKNAPVNIRSGATLTFDYYVGDVENDARNGFLVEFANSLVELDKYGYYGYNDYYSGSMRYCGVEFVPDAICTIGCDRYNPRHIGILSNYTGKTQHVATNGAIPEIADSCWHHVKIKCTSKSIKVYQDGSLVLSAKTQIPEISYIGITASTSYWGYENHKVRNLKVSSNSLPKIRLDANGGKCPVSSMYIVSNGSTKLPSATRAGYTFLGWYTDRTGGRKINSSAYTFRNGETIYARWRANKYSISFQANGGTVSSAKKTVTYGASCGALPTPTRTKGKFLGWYTAKTGGTKYTSSTKYLVAGNKTLYAHWKMTKYTVKFNGNGGKASFLSRAVDYGSKIGSLPTASRSNYSFLGWYTKKNGGTKITASYKVTKNITVYAHWKKRSGTGGGDGGGDGDGGGRRCAVCNGTGEIRCGTCGGSGSYYWSGQGYRTCYNCHGSGKKACTSCGGDGYL